MKTHLNMVNTIHINRSKHPIRSGTTIESEKYWQEGYSNEVGYEDPVFLDLS